MAIKRFTFEIDDAPDSKKRTSSPDTLLAKEDVVPEPKEITDVPGRQAQYEEVSVEKKTPSKLEEQKQVGRTFYDVFYTFINEPEFAAVALFLAAFVIRGPWFKITAGDFIVSGILGLILNAIWFGIRFVRKNNGRKMNDN